MDCHFIVYHTVVYSTDLYCNIQAIWPEFCLICENYLHLTPYLLTLGSKYVSPPDIQVPIFYSGSAKCLIPHDLFVIELHPSAI